MIGNVWVEPNSSAAGSRMLQLIHTFLSQNWKVTFGTTSLKKPNSIDLTILGVEEVYLELNNPSFDDYIKNLNPTIVVFDRFLTEEQFGWRVAELCPNALRILDTEDLHCLRKTRHEAVKKDIDFTIDLLLNSDITKREIASIYRCDFSLIISTFEMNLLQEVFKIKKELLIHLPFFLDEIDQKKITSWKSFDDRKHFISIGNFLHAPNLDATIQLKKKIWNLIKEQIPTAEIHIYGAYPNQQVLEFHNPKEGFFVHGFVEDSNQVVKEAKVLLAPLRFGAGIKGKLTEAMQNGTPSVTTKIGMEGMCDGLAWNGFVEDETKKIVEKAVELYTNKEIWKKSQQNGVEIINKYYNVKKLQKNLLNKVEVTYRDLNTLRNLNFIGKMLQHHTLKSSKFMSKWIEEKNNN